MKKYTVAFASITYASKAKAVLEENGINAVIGRTPKSLAGGCGYSVTAEASADRITALLEKNNIRYRSITEGRGG
ncbi:MAG: DUF3343 domain-containing protein [Huintestinicola sp.]